jgi:hypothetical protein
VQGSHQDINLQRYPSRYRFDSLTTGFIGIATEADRLHIDRTAPTHTHGAAVKPGCDRPARPPGVPRAEVTLRAAQAVTAQKIASTIIQVDPDPVALARLRSSITKQNAAIRALDIKQSLRRHQTWWASVTASLGPEENTKDLFWTAVSRLRSTAKAPFPSNLCGPKGRTFNTKDGILAEIEQHFTRTSKNEDSDAINFNARPHNPITPSDTLEKAKSKRSELLSLHAASPAPTTNMPDLKTILAKINAGKNGKSPGPLGDTYELWKNCGDLAQGCLGRLFQLFWLSGHIPAAINGSHLILLKKDQSEADRVKGYRPITLLNTIVKLYESVLLERLTSHVNNHSALSRLQHACRPGRGASHAIGQIYETIHQNPKVCLIALDASKAFDRVNHDILFQRLADVEGVEVALWKAIHSTYEHARTSTKINVTVSEAFSLPCGVRQGAVLSPLLFAIYIDPLLRSIDALDTSLRTNGLRTPAQGFVDDLLVTASNLRDMEAILNTTEKFCHDNGAVINWTKTAIAHNSMSDEAAIISDNLDLDKSRTKPHIKYLGHWLSPKASPDFWSAHAEDRCAKAKRAFNILGRRGLRQQDDSDPSMQASFCTTQS